MIANWNFRKEREHYIVMIKFIAWGWVKKTFVLYDSYYDSCFLTVNVSWINY